MATLELLLAAHNHEHPALMVSCACPQGMNFLAALMLLWLPREAEAFGALALLMRERGLRDLYKTDMAMLQVLPLWWCWERCWEHQACGSVCVMLVPDPAM